MKEKRYLKIGAGLKVVVVRGENFTFKHHCCFKIDQPALDILRISNRRTRNSVFKELSERYSKE